MKLMLGSILCVLFALPPDVRGQSPFFPGSDSVALETFSDTSAAPDSVREAKRDKLKVVKRDYNYREQITLSLFMMGLVAVMMSTAQAWNPD